MSADNEVVSLVTRGECVHIKATFHDLLPTSKSKNYVTSEYQVVYGPCSSCVGHFLSSNKCPTQLEQGPFITQLLKTQSILVQGRLPQDMDRLRSAAIS